LGTLLAIHGRFKIISRLVIIEKRYEEKKSDIKKREGDRKKKSE
jgi:hypothetical protein